MCVYTVCILAFVHFLALTASLSSNWCAHTCLFFVHLSPVFACIYVKISLFLVPMLEYILLIAWECDFTWCAVNACKTDSILRWTLDLLGTRWRQASCLPEPSHNDWDEISCLCAPMCNVEVSKKEITNRQFLLRTLTHFKYKDCFKWKYFLFAAWRRV